MEHAVDSTGQKISRVEANIQYNYGPPFEGDRTRGKRPKNCVGSPPPDRLDKKSLGLNLVIDDLKTFVNEDSEAGMSIMFYCPPGCAAINADVYGNHWYDDSSSICRAAIHDGIISSDSGGYFQITYERIAFIWNTAYLNGTSNNTIVSKDIDIDAAYRVFSFETYNVSTNIVHTVAGQPSANLESPCGDTDGQPSTFASFNGPAGLSARSGVELSDTEFMYIADASNNKIRAMSATCTQICENGSRCTKADTCTCLTGWTGIDCTKPICSTPALINQINKVCVGPNIWACKPGYEGENCDRAQCAASADGRPQCRNGGKCNSPDTCTCPKGWFDLNCGTPVCQQTCGNFGNCTAPDTCSCPSQWKGTDCRIPVCNGFTCKNGGICIAPDTCVCPPQWIGHDCSVPVCTQGYFRRNPTEEEKKGLLPRKYQTDIIYWPTFKPCNTMGWCKATNEFECDQKEYVYNVKKVPFGGSNRNITGRKSPPDRCMIIQLPIDYKVPYQLLYADGTISSYSRFSPKSPYESNEKNAWRGYESPTANHTGPWSYIADRQLALVDWLDVSQGVYVCANGGNCTAPDVCVCAPGWIGFDCRTPVCNQGYYQPQQTKYSSGVNSAQEFDKVFLRFVSNTTARLTWPYSNRQYQQEFERYENVSTQLRVIETHGGTRYLAINITSGDEGVQGGYRCSIRSQTIYENSTFLFEHPNFYSRYMESTEQKDDVTNTLWTGMGWPAVYKKSKILDQVFHNITYIYTNEGYRRYVFFNSLISSMSLPLFVSHSLNLPLHRSLGMAFGVKHLTKNGSTVYVLWSTRGNAWGIPLNSSIYCRTNQMQPH